MQKSRGLLLLLRSLLSPHFHSDSPGGSETEATDGIQQPHTGKYFSTKREAAIQRPRDSVGNKPTFSLFCELTRQKRWAEYIPPIRLFNLYKHINLPQGYGRQSV